MEVQRKYYDLIILNVVLFIIIFLEMCICSVIGDLYYRMYDGQMIYFMGVCKYLMIRFFIKNDLCVFSVEVKNEYRGRN